MLALCSYIVRLLIKKPNMHKLIFRVLKFPTAVGKVLKHLCCVFICKLERQSNDLHLLQLSVTVYLLIKEGVPEKSCRSLLIWRKKKKGKPKICSSGLPVVGTCLPAKQRNNFIILVLENFLTVGSKDTERGEDRGNLIRR